MNELLAKLEKEILVLDGAMGTELQKRSLPVGDCPEELNLTNPAGIKEIHKDYVQAGSDIIQTNTFGANRLKLAEYDLAAKTEKINQQAAQLARETAETDKFVSGSMGPTGQLLAPMGDLSFKTAYQAFREQAQALEAGGVDIINIETMTDLQEARAALIAVKENTSLPVICNLTYDEQLKTVTGTDPITAITVLTSLGADVIGANCSLGPEKLVEVMEIMGQHTDKLLCVQPNAGLPELDEDGNTIFPMQAEKMASYVPDFIQAGVNIIGGCCGSGPEYIKQTVEQAANWKPVPRSQKQITALASRTEVVTISDSGPTRIIGERINPSGREKLSQQLKEDNLELVAQEAAEQVAAGADILDVNVGVPELDQAVAMQSALTTLQEVTSVPVSLDSTDPEVLEAGLQRFVGKPLINSVTGEQESMETVLPLACKYGAAVLGLTLDEDGIPDTAEGRLQVAEKIVHQAEEYGLNRQDILIDTLALAASAQQETVQETMRAIKLIKDKLGVATVLGISNVSYGLPVRTQVNTAYLAMAIQAGLNAPIMDPTEDKMKGALLASDLLVNRDPDAERYLEHYSNVENNQAASEQPTEETSSLTDPLAIIEQQVINGDKENIEQQIESALHQYQPMEIINQGLIPGIEEVGTRYDEGTYFLPQLMQGAEAMQKSFSRLKPLIAAQGEVESPGRVLLATVKGDIHDIGKNIVKVMFENKGFVVIDLGKDVPNQEIINQVQEQKIDLVGLSALMTTTMPRMEEVTTAIKEIDPDCQVLLGGAVVTEEYAANIGADGYAANAVKAVAKAEQLLSS